MTNYSGTINLSISGEDDKNDTFNAAAPIGISLASLTLNNKTVQGTGGISGTISATVHYANGSAYSGSYPFNFQNLAVSTPLSNFNVPLGPLGTEFGISITETASFNASRSTITLAGSGTFDRVSNGYHLTGSAVISGTLAATTSVFSIAPIAPAYGTEWRSQYGNTPFTFTVSRVGNTSAAGSTKWTVAGSGAQPATGSDFVGGVLPSGTVNFAPGQTSQTITVDATAGDPVALDDGFTVSVPAPSSGELLIDSGTNSVKETIQNPLDTVVHISFTFADGTSGQASGVLIGPSEVLTAAHVLQDTVHGSVRTSSIVVTPAYNVGGTTAPYGSAGALSVNPDTNFQDPGGKITLGTTPFDYGIITLNSSFANLGYMSLYSDGGTNFTGGVVNVSGYPGAVSLANSQESVTVDPSNSSVLDGAALGQGASGGPVWIYGSNGDPEVVGVVSGGNSVPNGYLTQIGINAVGQINQWLGLAEGLAVADNSTGQPVGAAGTPYSGPVSGLQSEYANITADSLNVSVNTPNWFLHTGSGNDGLAANSGINVLDGGTGSNFLTGGGGTDTFFVDDRVATADIWSTVNNFHTGDAATIWGVTPQDFNLAWVDGQGAAGYTGLTLHATSAGQPTASLTLAGFSQADLSNGRLSVSYGSVGGSAYMYVYDNR